MLKRLSFTFVLHRSSTLRLGTGGRHYGWSFITSRGLVLGNTNWTCDHYRYLLDISKITQVWLPSITAIETTRILNRKYHNHGSSTKQLHPEEEELNPRERQLHRSKNTIEVQ